jgi:hypothetical protein
MKCLLTGAFAVLVTSVYLFAFDGTGEPLVKVGDWVLLVLQDKAIDEFNLARWGRSAQPSDPSTLTVLAKVSSIYPESERVVLSALSTVGGDSVTPAIVQITGNVPMTSLRSTADSDETVSSSDPNAIQSIDVYGVSPAPETFPRLSVLVSEFQHANRQQNRLFLKVYEQISIQQRNAAAQKVLNDLPVSK